MEKTTALETYKGTDFQFLAPEIQKTILTYLLETYEGGKTVQQLANELNKSSATIHRLLKKTTAYKPRPATHKPKIESMDLEWEKETHSKNKKEAKSNAIVTTVLICPYCWSISGACCPNDDYLELSGYIYKIFLESDNETRKQIIESEQNKKYQSIKEQSNIIRLLAGINANEISISSPP